MKYTLSDFQSLLNQPMGFQSIVVEFLLPIQKLMRSMNSKMLLKW